MHPLVVRKFIYPLHEYSKGKPTFDWLPVLEQSQWRQREQILGDQEAALRDFVAYAYQHVPYYRRLMDERGVRSRDIQSRAELAHLPYLTKADVRSHFKELQASPRPPRTQTISTGGSTGAPATVLVSMESHGFAEAARLRAQGWFGLTPGDREMVLWGSPIELGRQSRWREGRDRLLNTRLLSAFDLSEAALAGYVKRIGAFRPLKLYGYASALAHLAGYMLQTGQTVHADWPKAIFATAEPLLPHQRQAIQQAFHCAVVGEYGARDAGLIAHECPAGRFHINAERIIVEVEEDKQFGVPGKGEIVVTNLLSNAMPLIRYRTGDVGQLDSAECSCGRGLPLLSHVEGRQTDFLVTPSGRVLHALAIIYAIREAPGVTEFQVVQQSAADVVIRLVTDDNFSDGAGKTIIAKARLALGNEVSVAIERVSTIPRLPSGKFRYVVSAVADKILGAHGESSGTPDSASRVSAAN
jgi:phenylacetate-CoA ligase